MKISKLFHWLYAILMFLPILVFIPNAFYYGFNQQAVAQQKTEQVPVYYETNEVNSIDDLISNRIYHWKDNYTPTTSNGYTQVLFLINYISQVGFVNNGEIVLGSTGNIVFRYIPDNEYIYINLNSTPTDIVITGTVYTDSFMNTLVPYFEESDLLIVKEYQPLTTNMSITDSMSYAWKTTWQNELFSWSYDSFLTQPFLYITNLFNVPATNTLLYCLSYWLNISIIWLCFDVVMYVPLLVHRWLDKGIIE